MHKNKQELHEQIENPESKEPVKLYLEEPFREYVQEKYLVEDQSILMNPTIMQMIYALEWYDIPRTAYSQLIEYHPYLTKGDYDKLYYANTQHRIENTISMSLFTIVANRLLGNRQSQIFKRRAVRWPTALFAAGSLTYIFNMFILRPIYLNDVQELGLADKYFFLDLNADLMKEDLAAMGIKIDAKNFDLQQTEQRLEEHRARTERQSK